uniref:glycosyltransferase family 4 protein n=1 Tax=Thermogutta sp. TaxID=1962930 RepID=UPI00321FCA8E
MHNPEHSNIRLCVITPQPTPYRDPFWNTVAEQPGVELDVFYCYAKGDDRPWDLDWPWKFRGEVLRGWPLLGHHNGYWNPGILKRLGEKRYDAIILGGYNHFTMLAAAWYARRKGIPYLVMCESFHGLKRAGYKKAIKGRLVRWVVGHSAGILPTGQLARDYLVSYGGPADQCAFVPNSPDLDSLRQEAARLRTDRDKVRKELGLGDMPAIIFVGRLIWKKGVDLLIRAFSQVVRDMPAQLIICGDGPERSRLVYLASQLGVRESVRFVGFRQPRELPRWYCACDLFVLPSRSEPWGVVVMEALALGLPVVVTDLVGCHPDVINSPEVGRVVPAGNWQALAAVLKELLTVSTPHSQIDQLWEGVYQQMRHPTVAK